MRPQKQLFLHRPEEGSFGDCWRAAIACVLDLSVETVPHFAMIGLEGDPGAYMVETRRWLKEECGLTFLQVPFVGSNLDVVLAMAGTLNPDVHYLLTARNARGVDHNVVCLNGQVVWDPSLEPTDIVGPASDGHWWIGYFGIAH